VSETALAVEVRDRSGKGAARKLRAQGRIPAVLYGRGKQAVALSLDPTLLQRLLSTSHAGINTLIDLQGGESVAGRTVLVKELQRDPVRGRILHADLFEVDLAETVEVSVPVHVRGTARGVTLGGILDHTLREIELECLPRAIPDEIVIDVSDLDIGQGVHVRDLALPGGVVLLTDPDLAVLQVRLPAAEEEARPEAIEGAAVAEGAPAEGAGGEGAAGEKAGE
jgi:large subunit ribosomal protein L25